MQEFFGDRAVSCTVTGKDSEKIVFKRASKSYGSYLENFVYSGLLQDNTKLVNGDAITNNGNTYYMVARRHGAFSEIGKLIQCNTTVDLVKKVKKYVDHEFVGYEDTIVASVPANFREVSGAVKLYDPGLLPTTTVKLIVPIVSIAVKDRVKVKGNILTIDFIDSTTNDGVYTLQCSPDNGKASS